MHDGGGVFERDAGEIGAKDFAGLLVHLMVGQPQRDLGNLRGEFFDFDAVELIDIELGQRVDFEQLISFVQFFEDF